MITLKALRGLSQYPHACYQQLYLSYIQDLNRRNYPAYTFSDAYALAQTAICFLCEFIGKELTDVYTVKNGKVITIKHAVYTLLGRYVLGMLFLAGVRYLASPKRRNADGYSDITFFLPRTFLARTPENAGFLILPPSKKAYPLVCFFCLRTTKRCVK